MEGLPHLGLYRRLTAAALVVGPALFLLDNLLHPKEFPRDHEAEQLARIGASYTRWQVAHGIGLLAVIAMTGALLGLAFHVRRSRPGLGLAGGALIVAGAVGLGAGLAIDGFTWGVVGAVSTDHRAAPGSAAFTLHTIQHSRWLIPYYGLAGVWVLGVLTLVAGSLRTIPIWAGALLGAGAVLAALDFVIEHNWFFIASAAVLLVGAAAVGAVIARMDDRAFAGA